MVGSSAFTGNFDVISSDMYWHRLLMFIATEPHALMNNYQFNRIGNRARKRCQCQIQFCWDARRVEWQIWNRRSNRTSTVTFLSRFFHLRWSQSLSILICNSINSNSSTSASVNFLFHSTSSSSPSSFACFGIVSISSGIWKSGAAPCSIWFSFILCCVCFLWIVLNNNLLASFLSTSILHCSLAHSMYTAQPDELSWYHTHDTMRSNLSIKKSACSRTLHMSS